MFNGKCSERSRRFLILFFFVACSFSSPPTPILSHRLCHFCYLYFCLHLSNSRQRCLFPFSQICLQSMSHPPFPLACRICVGIYRSSAAHGERVCCLSFNNPDFHFPRSLMTSQIAPNMSSNDYIYIYTVHIQYTSLKDQPIKVNFQVTTY